jgi:HD-GYP domain-containing protein (c-di-GMP phosphodiesterase class II)
MTAQMKLRSIEDASVIRKFSVLFSLMSLLPFVTLSTLFFIFVNSRSFKIINALAMAVEARDTYSRGHSERVGEYAVKIAEHIRLDEKKIQLIKAAAILHDVGKIGITDDVLRKPGGLNDYEWEIMRQHPAIGEGIILPLHGFADLKSPIRHHHEWFDGTGYPDHLKREMIPIESRILTVADSFDAMTSDRPYRKKLSFEEAKQDLLKYSGTRYDPAIVRAFLETMHLR